MKKRRKSRGSDLIRLMKVKVLACLISGKKPLSICLLLRRLFRRKKSR